MFVSFRLCQGGYIFAHVRLFVCPSFSKIMQSLPGWFHLVEGCSMGQRKLEKLIKFWRRSAFCFFHWPWRRSGALQSAIPAFTYKILASFYFHRINWRTPKDLISQKRQWRCVSSFINAHKNNDSPARPSIICWQSQTDLALIYTLGLILPL